ncbi:MAG: hypothetical protein FWG23_05850 [Eggerthellaceae bacterium]|nr:hypothetical protein [Eggerthellaceae bacterium]
MKCPSCELDNRFDIVVQNPPVPRQCAGCGRDLTAESIPPAAWCKNQARPCANPCHFHTIDPNPAVKRICWQNTPSPAPSPASPAEPSTIPANSSPVPAG